MDPSIIKKAKSGDIEALGLLIEKYQDIAFNLALGIVKDKDSAKDIVQDSFVKVLDKIYTFRNDSKFSTWLYRIVFNQSLAFLKQEKTKNSRMKLENIEVEYIPNLGNEEEDIQKLYHAIELLEDNDKNILLLFYYAEKSVKEISIITGFSKSNVKVILHRTRKKLKTIIKNERNR